MKAERVRAFVEAFAAKAGEAKGLLSRSFLSKGTRTEFIRQVEDRVKRISYSFPG
jgi:hypothetical protein